MESNKKQNIFLDILKIKPILTNENENGITVFLPNISSNDKTGENIMRPVDKNTDDRQTTQILRDLTDEGTKAVDFAKKIRENKLLGIKGRITEPSILQPRQSEPKKRTQPSENVINAETTEVIEGAEVTDATPSIKKSRPSTKATFKNVPINAVYELIDKNLMIGSKKLIDRIPLPPENLMKVPNYIMNNRLAFIKFANEILFRTYKELMDDEVNQPKITCDSLLSTSSKSGLMLHQQLVRDYLNLITPYRGLLLYHGLGSGKTCSSIAIAEGMKDSKKIIVMLPASLHRNYIEEIKKCGDPIFKRNQYWEWIEVNRNDSSEENTRLKKNLSLILSISTEEIVNKGGAWITDISKPSNISTLSPNQLKSLNNQLDSMISSKYQLIHYNGLQKSKFKAMTNDYTTNIFDNAVIIIDEAHNLISRIVNKISKLKKSSDTKASRKFSRESVNRGIENSDDLSLQLYHMLMMAENCKIVLLTGTPIINYPNEIGILFNILRGYIKTWTFNLRPAQGTTTIINEANLKRMFFSKNKILDYMKYTPTSQKLIITRNPFGFENVIKENREREQTGEEYTYQGVSNTPAKKKDDDGRTYYKERKLISDDEFQRNIIHLLGNNEIQATFEGIKYNLALPDRLDEFVSSFIEINESGRMKNEMKFKKRIMGLTSYFRSAQEELLPRYDKKINKRVVRIPMSNFQFKLYATYRKDERTIETKSKMNNQIENVNELFKSQSSTYRIMSRLACNITLPDRPNLMHYKKNNRPNEEGKEDAQIGEEKNDTVQVKPKTKKSVKFAETPQPESTRPQAESVQSELSTTRPQTESVQSELSTTRPQAELASTRPQAELASTRLPESTRPQAELVQSELVQSELASSELASSRQTNSLAVSKVEELLNSRNLPLDRKNSILESIREFEKSDLGKKYKFEKMKEKDQTIMIKNLTKYINQTETKPTLTFSNFFQSLLEKASEKKNSEKKGGKSPKWWFKKFLKHGGLGDDVVDDGDDMVEINPIDQNVQTDDNIIENLEENIDNAIDNTTSIDYKTDILNFMNNLKRNAPQFLSMESRSDELPPLAIYSPKYVEIINNIRSDEHLGLHLLYSQFRNMEGLAIFSMALDTNGFKQFKLVKNRSGVLEVSRDVLESDKLIYAMYTGEETSDERELIRKIYNGDWNEIPQNIREQLQTKSINNNMGEIIKLLMITSAGAEGINLRNTRYVHIVEPYWHPVRVEQVIGRARRICSHNGLPIELQTVEVFVYVSVFTEEQLRLDDAKEINRNDTSMVAPFRAESSDEKLLNTSNIKEAVSENILKSVKETSIDCATYSSMNENKEGLKCLAFNSAKIDEFSYVPDYEDQQQDTDIPLGQIRRTTEFKKLKLRDGTSYLLNPRTEEIYNEADISQPNPQAIGRLTQLKTVNENGETILSGKTTIQFYKKSALIDENA
jgi:hypothetical protein